MCHRQFLEELRKIMIMFQRLAMIEEIRFISYVVNGFYIIIHKVIWYDYMYSNMNINIFILILV